MFGPAPPEWHGVPIMPGVSSGRQDQAGYVFVIRDGPSEIAEFYVQEMAKRGYELIPGNALSEDGLFYTLRFRRGEESRVITIMPHAGAVDVLISK